MQSRPISRSELAAQGRFNSDGGQSGGVFSNFFGGSSSKSPSAGYGMASSTSYNRQYLSPKVYEYDEVGYGYDERYSSPILEFPEAVYNYLIHPIASGTYHTGRALVHGTGAVVGAGYHGATFVAGGVGKGIGAGVGAVGAGVGAVGSGIGGGVTYVGSEISSGARDGYNAVSYDGYPNYRQSSYVTTSGSGVLQQPLTASTISSPTVSPFATSKRLPTAAAPVTTVPVSQIALSDGDYFVSGSAPVVASTAPMVASTSPKSQYVTPAKVLN